MPAGLITIPSSSRTVEIEIDINRRLLHQHINARLINRLNKRKLSNLIDAKFHSILLLSESNSLFPASKTQIELT